MIQRENKLYADKILLITFNYLPTNMLTQQLIEDSDVATQIALISDVVTIFTTGADSLHIS